MRLKLFIASLVLIPLFSGCNKYESLDYNKLIIGEWRQAHYLIKNEEDNISHEEFKNENEEYPYQWKFDKDGFWYEMNNDKKLNIFELAGKYQINTNEENLLILT